MPSVISETITAFLEQGLKPSYCHHRVCTKPIGLYQRIKANQSPSHRAHVNMNFPVIFLKFQLAATSQYLRWLSFNFLLFRLRSGVTHHRLISAPLSAWLEPILHLWRCFFGCVNGLKGLMNELD